MKYLNDDINKINENELVLERILYYKKYNIGFTARSIKNRKGRFKKASNINAWLNKIEGENKEENKEKEKRNRWTNVLLDIDIDKNKLISSGDIHLGKYFVLIDSDSIIPVNFMNIIIYEFENEDKLAYTQNYTLPLESSNQNYFSRMISHFTINLYDIIFRVTTRNGDICPLIGHNIMIRTSAFMEVTNIKNREGYVEYWSENRVSEDFDLCLRLNAKGYYGRYICYANSEFREGVSLTYKDEMVKYSKFAYGASEILLNPIKSWRKEGIVTKSFKEFILSKEVVWTSRVLIYGYLMSYFSIGSSIILSPIVLIVSCYFKEWDIIFYDVFYGFIFLTLIFAVLNPMVTYILKIRLKSSENSNIKPSLIKEYYSGIFFLLFYSSISFPIFIGLISHLLDLKISWGSTIKSLETDNLKNILIKIIIDERKQLGLMIIYLNLFIFIYFYINCYNVYIVNSLFSIIIGHIITPFVLNPSLFGLSKYEFNTEDTPFEINQVI